LDPNLLIYKSLRVIGTMVGTMEDTQKVLEFAARVSLVVIVWSEIKLMIFFLQGQLKAVYESYPIDQLPQAVAKLKDGQVAGRLVVDFNA
jgi:propanol-preferring alcohol dehydrogenase